MAISFSRPDPSSPAAVSTANFSVTRRGYEPEEVREFLRMVAAELARLQEREKFLERELRTAQRSVPTAAVALDEEVVTRMLGEEAARILSTSREAASQIKVRAEEGAARVLREATDEAQRLREEAGIEASRRRQDAAADAESELQMAKQQGREMVNEARAYRERVLGELARRREMARQQIEQLVHGRDRLLQAFERARIAAVDVMAEMTPLGEPSEYVNLSPTTGPVPVMVPANDLRSRLAAAEPAPVAAVVEDTVVAVEVEDTVVAVEVTVVDIEVVEGAVDETAVLLRSTDEVDLGEEPDAADLAQIEAELADTEPVAENDEEAHDEEAHDDGATIAPVVALFGNDARNDHESAPAADAADSADSADSADDAPKATVDDLFARLRAARATSVIERATAADASTHDATKDDATKDDATTVAVEAEVEADAVATETEPAVEAPAAVARDLVIVGDDISVFQASPIAPVEQVDADDSPFGRRDAELTPLIVTSARKLKRVLADEQNDVLHVLRRRDPVRALDTLLPWEGEHVLRYAAAIETELEAAALAGAASIDDGDRGDHLRDIKTQQALQPAIATLTSSIIAPLRERLERAVTDANGDNGDLADAVRSLYREWKTQRIDEHLDDIARMAFGRGALVALQPGTPICWTVDPNGPDCPDAEDNALAGEIRAGQPFPTDHTCAPAHEGCRCMLLPAPR